MNQVSKKAGVGGAVLIRCQLQAGLRDRRRLLHGETPVAKSRTPSFPRGRQSTGALLKARPEGRPRARESWMVEVLRCERAASVSSNRKSEVPGNGSFDHGDQGHGKRQIRLMF
jgi:hypothetical protein